MYKTVRHGENSLQYTILPQTEEVLNNSGLKGKGRDYSPSIHVRRGRRKSNVKLILALGIAILVTVGIACIPIYLINHALIDRWLNNQASRDSMVTSAPITPVVKEPVRTRKKELKITAAVVATLQSKLETSPSTSTTTTYATTTTTQPTVSSVLTPDKSTTPPWIMPALKSWKSSSTIQTIPTEGNDIPLMVKPIRKELTATDNMSIKPWEKDVIIRPTVTPETITSNIVIKLSRSTTEKPLISNTKLFDDVLITTKKLTTPVAVTTEISSEQSKMKDLKDALLSVDDDDDFKESLEVDEVFSLPPLKPDIPGSDSDEVTVAKADAGWYGARWPFVDTSSYFQWTGYSPGDNLLLPLLVAALSSIALVLLLALAVRRRKRTHSSNAQSGITSELQADDNTNLLTAENGEDADE